MTERTSGQRTSDFVAFLRELAAPGREDRAALAALRRGLGKRPGEAAEMFSIVVPRLPPGLGAWREECHYLVASLFAWHPDHWSGEGGGWRTRNLGASLRRLTDEAESDGPERRFTALLNCDADDVAEHLRGVIGLLRTKQIPVDWQQLLVDLSRWESGDREVQRRWATAFWGNAWEEGGSRSDETRAKV